MINIRGLSGGDAKILEDIGLNAVVITAEAGGLGEVQNRARYGNVEFVNHSIKMVLDFLNKKYNKNLTVNKLCLESWSGGFGAIVDILSNKGKLFYSLDSVIILDGIHHSIFGSKPPQVNRVAMQPWVDYAMECMKGKSKFIVAHTAVVPGSYVSTTDTSNYLLSQLNLIRGDVPNYKFKVKTPVSYVESGGFYCYQLYDKVEPYMLNGRANIPGTMGYEHIVANNFKKDIWQRHLIPFWNEIKKEIEVVKEEKVIVKIPDVSMESNRGIISMIYSVFLMILNIFTKNKK